MAALFAITGSAKSAEEAEAELKAYSETIG
ncbi:hypothetical protein QFZ58_000685 [Streptomyces sp. B1I3]|nr:hypothetical protein [Streptomyces sp. B1I3]